MQIDKRLFAAKMIATATILIAFSVSAADQTFQAAVDPFLQAHCVQCHDQQTESGLDVTSLDHDLSKQDAFPIWKKIFDRVQNGEMPPASEKRPGKDELNTTLSVLKKNLTAASRAEQQKHGRVPTRRLTKRQLDYTLQDLLLIDGPLTNLIPDEVESGSFETVGVYQRISAVHLENYLKTADEALDRAIALGTNPYRVINTKYERLDEWHDKPLSLGGSVTRKLKFGDGIVLFSDIDYLTQFTFAIPAPGRYRLKAVAAAYQSETPITAKIIVKENNGNARLAKSVDLQSFEPQTIIVETSLKPGDVPYLTFDIEGQSPYQKLAAAGSSKNYKGRGLAIMSQSVEGPLVDSWPPASTKFVLNGLRIGLQNDQKVKVTATGPKLEHIEKIIRNIGPRTLRRNVSEAEIQSFVKLAEPAIKEGRPIVDAARVSLRSLFSSPAFLLFGGEPGPLDDHDLASRLSYFLWMSLPDQTLRTLADEGKLSDPKVLAEQTDRMLADPKSKRFVTDFVGQWLRLYKVNVTSPDDGLYPEFDELLGDAIPQETQLFFQHLIAENMSLTNLIDSDFTFLNRRLAKHYGLKNVKGQHFRKFTFPNDSPRGGVLTQAAILKTTANGTTTSPVTRGNFVLSNFLGTPPSPPPPDIGSIEPDTRGKTTIREILAAHRDMETCNQCHKHIDPPGFALESFDPIGGFRDYYRVSAGEQTFAGFTFKPPPMPGKKVDSSGVTADGNRFTGIIEFKKHLMDRKEQVAKNFISQLTVYATGAEIQFADRSEIESILLQSAKTDYGIKDILHAIIQSRLFRNK